MYAVSIALEHAGEVVLGVIFDPSHDELFVAERGAGASLNGRPLAVSSAAVLDEGLLATGFPYDIRDTRDTNLSEYAAFSLRTRGVRRMGSAALDLAYVAAGRLDGYWELRLGPWDAAAGALLVEEAGGRITNLDGGRLDLEAPSVVASNGLIHEAMLHVLREIRSAPRSGDG
jgi:myo-inositol-1(or 4)-monophosphatase